MAEARSSGLDVELALVEMAGLTKAVKGLSVAEAAVVVDSMTDVLRAEAFSGGAVRLKDERFAVMREKIHGADTLPNRLKTAAAEAGAAVEPSSASIPIDSSSGPQTLRALRFTLDQFVKDDAEIDGDLASVFRAGLDTTLSQAKAFSQAVKTKRFKLVYQPIVDLASRDVRHYEALVRFPGEESPAEAIRMAEELDLIEALDLAVTEEVVAVLRTYGPPVRIAVNVSGRSFLQPKFLDRLLAIAAGDVRLKGRMLLEITESAALANLPLAEERIQRLRRHGFQVCLDDFGAGSASLSYLRNLTVDVVKIDGQYVREIENGGRDGTMIRHLTALCKELKIDTIAEMVESQSAADMLKSLGVRMGQGYFFGPPLDHIPSAAPQSMARRRGAVESWG